MNEDLERDLAGTGMLDFAAALRAAPQARVSADFADGVMAAVRAERARYAAEFFSPLTEEERETLGMLMSKLAETKKE